ncbi:hypothetical protein SteCoe_21273 [Stentor coeruleus]|uniref:Uncharacterized protein n=1 Tax=Stentor coeruleus TaxID=5963 RepID=A0A1R2BPR5_9CILI|nr:hypothetical protein SteCoe_21273 [Stentor coeruleus]
MNNHLLKRQVDELFCSDIIDKFAAWRAFRIQVRNKISSPKSAFKTPTKKPYAKSKTPIIGFHKSPNIDRVKQDINRVKQEIDQIFPRKSFKDDCSIDFISEIQGKPDAPTISLKSHGISDILPLETIENIRMILKNPINESTEYIEELRLLAEDIIKNLDCEFMS